MGVHVRSVEISGRVSARAEALRRDHSISKARLMPDVSWAARGRNAEQARPSHPAAAQVQTVMRYRRPGRSRGPALDATCNPGERALQRDFEGGRHHPSRRGKCASVIRRSPTRLNQRKGLRRATRRIGCGLTKGRMPAGRHEAREAKDTRQRLPEGWRGPGAPDLPCAGARAADGVWCAH